MAEKKYNITKGEFSWALEHLKNNHRVHRSGWNGKNMWIQVQWPTEHSKMTQPFIFMRTVQGDYIPWLASQADLLSDDWEVVGDVA